MNWVQEARWILLCHKSRALAEVNLPVEEVAERDKTRSPKKFIHYILSCVRTLSTRHILGSTV